MPPFYDVLHYNTVLDTQRFEDRSKKYVDYMYTIYSKIPLLRPPKIKTNSPLKSIFKKCQSFFLCVFCTQCLLERDHLWDCSKVVFKTTFEQSQWWSYYKNFTVCNLYIPFGNNTVV